MNMMPIDTYVTDKKNSIKILHHLHNQLIWNIIVILLRDMNYSRRVFLFM